MQHVTPVGNGGAQIRSTIMTKHTTFREILDAVAGANAARLGARAHSFNRVAKLPQSAHSRAAAYVGKTRAAEQILAKFPERCRFLGIESTKLEQHFTADHADQILVGLNLGDKVCLHFPRGAFSREACCAVDRLRVEALATVMVGPATGERHSISGRCSILAAGGAATQPARQGFSAHQSGFFDHQVMEAA
jgi:hypothetical protein